MLTTAVVIASAVVAPANIAQQFSTYGGLRLNSDTLASVQKKLGPSHIFTTGDAGEFEAWVCYALPNAQVEFNSGEIGGGTDLLGFTLVRHGRNKHCPWWPKAVPQPSLSLGPIRLGASRAEFQAAFPRHVEWKQKTATATYEYQRLMTHQEVARLPEAARKATESDTSLLKLDVSFTVIGDFTHGHLVKLTVWQIETQ